MAHPTKNRLALVATPVEAGHDEHPTDRPGGLARLIAEIRRQQFEVGAVGDLLPIPSRCPSPDHRTPFCIRLTTEQILNVAEDASLRAQMLEWSTEGMPNRTQVLRRVSSLHEVAIDLRRAAAQLLDSWSEPKETS